MACLAVRKIVVSSAIGSDPGPCLLHLAVLDGSQSYALCHWLIVLSLLV